MKRARSTKIQNWIPSQHIIGISFVYTMESVNPVSLMVSDGSQPQEKMPMARHDNDAFFMLSSCERFRFSTISKIILHVLFVYTISQSFSLSFLYVQLQ